MATCNQAVISILQPKTVGLGDTKLQAQGYMSGKERIRFDLAKRFVQEEAPDPDRNARHTVYPEPSLIVSTIILPVGLGSAAHSRGRLLEMISRDRGLAC